MKMKSALIMSFIFLLLATLTLSTATGQVIKDGLVSYWTFDQSDVDDTIVKDVWGNNNGEMVGDITIVSGKFGNAIELHGPAAQGDYVKIPTLDISPKVYPQLTLTAWVYPTSTGEGGHKNRRFIFGHDDGGWDRGILMQDSGWRTGTGNDGVDYWETGAVVALDTWQHLAVVYDDDDIKFYHDGDEYSYGSAGKIGDGAPVLLIGAHPNMQRMFQGRLDDACVYERALSEDEIKQNAKGMAVAKEKKLAFIWGEIKVR